MPIVISTLSILAITGLIWLLNKSWSWKICPICAGVAATWIWILAGVYSGWLADESWKLTAAIAMAGSVVGISHRTERQPAFAKVSPDKLLLWKTLFIPTGFVAVYSLISTWWTIFAAATAFLIVLTLWFTGRKQDRVLPLNKTVKELEDKMKNCCS